MGSFGEQARIKQREFRALRTLNGLTTFLQGLHKESPATIESAGLIQWPRQG
jgi:hypothetical protein